MKTAGNPIRIGYKEAEDLAEWFLSNASYDERGAIRDFPRVAKLVELTDPLGQKRRYDVVIRPTPRKDMASHALFKGPIGAIFVWFNDLNNLYLNDHISREQYLSEQFKIGPDDAHWDRLREIASMLLHEFTHGVDPAMTSNRVSKNVRRDMKVQNSDRTPEQWKNYFEAPEEVRARLQEAVYEAANELDRALVSDPAKAPTIFQLLSRNAAVIALARQQKAFDFKKKILNQIYSAIYTMMVGRDIDPRTGERKQTKIAAADVVPIGGQQRWSAEVFEGLELVDFQEFGQDRQACWKWAHKRRKAGTRVRVLVEIVPDLTVGYEAATKAAQTDSWPESGWFEFDVGFKTEVRWTSENGKPFGPAKVKSWRHIDRYVLQNGKPVWHDQELRKV